MMVDRGEQAGFIDISARILVIGGDEELARQSTTALLSTAFNRFVSACRAELRG